MSTTVQPNTEQKWTVFLIHNSHIDIGYTHRQEAVAEYHRQFIEQAVRMAASDEQARWDERSKFKYTCEGFWAVELFLEKASPAQIEDLKQAVRNGTIELCANYFHLTELPDQGHLEEFLEPATAFARELGTPTQVAMACDINGFSWGMADALYNAGVRYLSVSINPHYGGYPFGKPLVPFYWETPSGNKILVYSGYTYKRANNLGLIPGKQMDLHPIPGLEFLEVSGQCRDTRDLAFAESKLIPLLAHLEQEAYPYRFLSLLGTGLGTDNGPPVFADEYSQHIANWNRKHGDRIEVRSATLLEFFRHIELSGVSLPTYRGDWNDWWSDGVISTPNETIMFRNAQRLKRTVERLDPDHRVVSVERLKQMSKALALYAEHTWGHASSVSSPWHLIVQQSLHRKGKFAVEAEELAYRALDDVLAAKGQAPYTCRDPFSYKVINPLPERRKGLVCLPGELSRLTDYLKRDFRLIDDRGRAYAWQLVNELGQRNIAVMMELDGFEERTLRVEFGPGDVQDAPPRTESQSFENEFYRVAWTAEQGIVSLVHLKTGSEMLEPGGLGLGAPVYQLYTEPDSRTTAHRQRTNPRNEIHYGKLSSVRQTENGPLRYKWEFAYEVKGASYYVVELTACSELPQLELRVKLHKDDVRDPEGLYVSFPLQARDGVWHLDKPGGPIRPGVDQLQETCCDYYLIQEGAVLAGASEGIAIGMPDSPMVHIGELRLWQYSTSIEPVGPLFSWLCNNKWSTNFKASCGGSYEFRYSLEMNEGFARAADGLRACADNNVPFIAIRTAEPR